MERVHDGTYGAGLISKFKKLDRPRIAVSIDMLDTGVDVPEVVNLVSCDQCSHVSSCGK